MRRPVLIFGMVLAGLTAVTTYADVENMIPNVALNWLRLFTVVLGAVGAFWVQSQTTELRDPKAKDGTPLVPADAEELPPPMPPKETRPVTVRVVDRGPRPPITDPPHE